MKPFEKYIELKHKAEEKGVEPASLSQYLHIAQVMNREEESYHNHRRYMLNWLKNIEKSVLEQIRIEDKD